MKTKISPAKALLALGLISATCAGIPVYAEGETQEQLEANFTQCLLDAYNNEQTNEEDKLTSFASNIPTRLGQLGRIKNVSCTSGSYALHDLTMLTSMESLFVNQVTNSTVDLSNNTALKSVGLINDHTENFEVTLPSNNLEDLYIRAESIKPLNLSNFNKLQSISLSGDVSFTLPTGNALKELSLYYNKHLSNLDLSTKPNLESLTLYACDVRSLDLSKNTNLAYLEIYNNPNAPDQSLAGQLTSLDLTNNTKLSTLEIVGQKITGLDLSKNTELAIVDLRDNKLTSLDLSNNKKLESVDLRNNDLRTVDLSSINDNTYVDLSGNDNLETVATPESWEEGHTDEEVRENLGLDDKQKNVDIQHGALSEKGSDDEEEGKKKTKVPNTGFGISEMAQYGAIVVLPAILMFAAIAKNATKARSKRVKFSR